MKILLTRKHSSRMRTTRFCGSGEGVGYLWSHVPSSGREVGYSGGRQWRIYIVKFWTRAPPPRGPNSFNFMQFLGKFGKIVCWRPPPRELAPPPRGNPGSATGRVSQGGRVYPPPEGTWDQRYLTPRKDMRPGTRKRTWHQRYPNSCENITFPQLHWRAVMTSLLLVCS